MKDHKKLFVFAQTGRQIILYIGLELVPIEHRGKFQFAKNSKPFCNFKNLQQKKTFIGFERYYDFSQNYQASFANEKKHFQFT